MKSKLIHQMESARISPRDSCIPKAGSKSGHVFTFEYLDHWRGKSYLNVRMFRNCHIKIFVNMFCGENNIGSTQAVEWIPSTELSLPQGQASS